MRVVPRDPVIPEVFEAISGQIRPARSGLLGRRLRRVMGVSALVTLAGGTALAGTQVWNPFTNPHAPSVASSSLPESTVAHLGVLRRAQTSEDRTAFVTTAIGLMPRISSDGVSVQGVRNLGPVRNYGDASSPPTGSLILIPVEKFDDGAKTIANAVCLYLAYDTSLSPVDPAADAGQAPTAQTGERASLPLRQRIGIEGSCSSTDDVKGGGLTIGGPEVGLMTGLVPDGVAKVSVEIASGEVLTQDVRDNAYQLAAPKAGQTFKPGTLTWLQADGKIVPHRERTNNG